MDRVATFVSEKTPRRVIAIASFIAILYLFRHLALLLVFFVTFERVIGAGSDNVARRTGLSNKLSVLSLVLTIVAVGHIALRSDRGTAFPAPSGTSNHSRAPQAHAV